MFTNRTEKPKAECRLESFVAKDIPLIVKGTSEKSDETNHKKPIYGDIGVFLQGVFEDMRFMYPNVQDHKQVIMHALKVTGDKD